MRRPVPGLVDVRAETTTSTVKEAMAIAAQFLLFLVLLVGGIVLVGLAQEAPVLPGLVFVAGIVSFSLAFFIPITIARRGMR